MGMTANFRVTFAGHPIDSAAAKALDDVGLVVRASHGVGSVAPGGLLPEPTNHSVYLQAANGDDALQRVTQALDGHGTFVAFEVEPFDVANPPSPVPGSSAPITVQLGRTTEFDTAIGMDVVLTLSDPSRDWRQRWIQMQQELDRLGEPRSNEFSGEQIHAAQHELQSFFIQTYHLKDALKVAAPSLGLEQGEIEQAIDNDPQLALVADLANLDKHFELDRPPRSGATPVITAVQGRRAGSAEGGWKLEMKISHRDRLLDGIEVARSAVSAWRVHLERWNLL
jgi:hypothetical protein